MIPSAVGCYQIVTICKLEEWQELELFWGLLWSHATTPPMGVMLYLVLQFLFNNQLILLPISSHIQYLPFWLGYETLGFHVVSFISCLFWLTPCSPPISDVISSPSLMKLSHCLSSFFLTSFYICVIFSTPLN